MHTGADELFKVKLRDRHTLAKASVFLWSRVYLLYLRRKKIVLFFSYSVVNVVCDVVVIFFFFFV